MQTNKFPLEERVQTSHAELAGSFWPNTGSKGVVLLPGISEYRSSFEPLASKLRDEFNVWAFDINGQGASSGIWRPDQMVDSVSQLLKQLRADYELEGLGVAGNSVGGVTAGIVAAKQPRLVDALALLSAPAGLQDVTPIARKVLRYTPARVLRAATIAFDVFETATNARYQEKTHRDFYTVDGYKPHAQFGATRIHDPKAFADSITQAPRLDAYASDIHQPTLAVYGGEARLFGISKNKLPAVTRQMLASIPGLEYTLIAPGADHSLNAQTPADACWNEDPNFAYVSLAVRNHFREFL